MAAKFDGVVEAIRYATEGQIGLVRVYERRGPTWTDRILLSREEFVQRLKSGKKYRLGSRIPQMASTFQLGEFVQLLQSEKGEFITCGSTPPDRDDLGGAPVF